MANFFKKTSKKIRSLLKVSKNSPNSGRGAESNLPEKLKNQSTRQGIWTPQGHQLVFFDGEKGDSVSNPSNTIGEERIELISIFGNRFFIIDRPKQDRGIYLQSINGDKLELFNGPESKDSVINLEDNQGNIVRIIPREGNNSEIQVSDHKGNKVVITSEDDQITITTNKDTVVNAERDVIVNAECNICLNAGKQVKMASAGGISGQALDDIHIDTKKTVFIKGDVAVDIDSSGGPVDITASGDVTLTSTGGVINLNP